MKKSKLLFFVTTSIICSTSFSTQNAMPSKYTELIKYVQPAPQQGHTGTCLYVASTGAIEMILNKKDQIKYPIPYGPNDLSESFLINAPFSYPIENKSNWEKIILKFNNGYGIHIDDWPFDAWTDFRINRNVWDSRNITNLKKINIPKIDTIRLFSIGNRWATNVLEKEHIDLIKKALWEHKSPVMVNYNHDGFWHMVLIVGYNDNLPGKCLLISSDECEDDVGSFYVRDSAEGMPVSVRDYDWFRVLGNTAIVVKEIE
jgi:hypothetical protein